MQGTLAFKWFSTINITERNDPPRSDTFKKAWKFNTLTEQKLGNFQTRMPERY